MDIFAFQVPTREIEKFTKNLSNFVGYYETSARENADGVEELFIDAMRAAMEKDPLNRHLPRDVIDAPGQLSCFGQILGMCTKF